MVATEPGLVPQCGHTVIALKKCHKERWYLAKLVGACNDAKTELDQCFRANKKDKQKSRNKQYRKDGTFYGRHWQAELEKQNITE